MTQNKVVDSKRPRILFQFKHFFKKKIELFLYHRYVLEDWLKWIQKKSTGQLVTGDFMA